MSGRFAVMPPSQFAASSTRGRISSTGSTAAIFARGSTVVRSRVRNDTSASGSASAGSSPPPRPPRRLREHLLRVEGRNTGREFRYRQRKISGDADEGAHAHDLAVAATAGRGGNPNDLARSVGFTGRRQPIVLAGGISRAFRTAGGNAAQRCLHPLRDGGKIAFAVERCKYGAAHQGRAAQARQDGGAEPLHRHAPAIDQAAVLAIDGQRLLIAEIDVLGLEARTKWSSL